MHATDYFEQLLFNAMIRNDAGAKAELAAVDLRVDLTTGVLSDSTTQIATAGRFTAGTAPGYTQISHAVLAAAFPAPGVAGGSNTLAALSFGTATSTWPQAKGTAFHDNNTGRILFYQDFSANPVTAGANDTVQYSQGALNVQVQ